jgi:PilZ domain
MVGLAERRSSPRTFMVCGVRIYRGESRHVGLIRDVSNGGLFVYSDFAPAVGETLRLEFRSALFVGRVIRVEVKDSGAATGIAVVITARRVENEEVTVPVRPGPEVRAQGG